MLPHRRNTFWYSKRITKALGWEKHDLTEGELQVLFPTFLLTNKSMTQIKNGRVGMPRILLSALENI